MGSSSSSSSKEAPPAFTNKLLREDQALCQDVERALTAGIADREVLLKRVQAASRRSTNLADVLNGYADVMEQPQLQAFCRIAEQARGYVDDFFAHRPEVQKRYPEECRRMDDLHYRFIDLLLETTLALGRTKTRAQFLHDRIGRAVDTLLQAKARLGETTPDLRGVTRTLDRIREWRERADLGSVTAKWRQFLADCQEMNSVWERIKRATAKSWKWLKIVAGTLAVIGVAALVVGVIMLTAGAGAAVAGATIAFWDFIAANAVAVGLAAGGVVTLGAATALWTSKHKKAEQLAEQAQEVLTALEEMMARARTLKDDVGLFAPLFLKREAGVREAERELGEDVADARNGVVGGEEFVDASCDGFRRIQEYLVEYQAKADEVVDKLQQSLEEMLERMPTSEDK